MRSDIFRIAEYARSQGLITALATNGTLVTDDCAAAIAKAGIHRVSVSIDGADALSHDGFRRFPGAFEAAWIGIERIKAEGIPFQVNTTVTKGNIGQLSEILDLAVTKGASALHLFLLVPTGCGKEIAEDEMIDPIEYERVLNWIYDRSKDAPIALKATCAPHYARIKQHRARIEGTSTGTSDKASLDTMTKGCLAGSGVCFVSSCGEVYPCGYLPVSAGNIREDDIESIWNNSEVFKLLRDPNKLKGKCGRCGYRVICMGCRARAYGCSGDFLAEEPFCVYEPSRKDMR